MLLLLRHCVGVLLLVVCAAAGAQPYPAAKPVRIVVPYAAGGTSGPVSALSA